MRYLIALLLFVPATLVAELSLPHFFSDHMVLQQERDAAIWGKADPHSQVIIQFKGRKATTRANFQGDWKARISVGPASSKGATLSIASGPDTLQIHDVLVGEVWFASGQSNMVFTVNRSPAYESVAASAHFPQIRMFNAPTVTADWPQYDIEGEWTLCSPKTAPGYSAVAFFFALKLHEELGVPIGIIKSAWGGKPVETFTSREALNRLPATKKLVNALLEKDAQYDPKKAKQRYESQLAVWEKADAEWRANRSKDKGRRPRKPVLAKRPLSTEGQPGVLFNSMIHPFVGYSIQGAIWYQGEANAKAGHVPYDITLPLMIQDWRQRWGDDFYFNFVQLANFRQPTTEPGVQDWWALLQDRQRLILDTTPKTGMAVINDVGEANDIHPKDKKTVGDRLARWSLAKTYGLDFVPSGPLYKSSQSRDGAIIINFDHVGKGLEIRGNGPLKRFEIAGNDRVWHWADATIASEDSVIISSPAVKKPIAARYAWASNPEGANLVNSLDLPTSIFRTDNWPDATTGR